MQDKQSALQLSRGTGMKRHLLQCGYGVFIVAALLVPLSGVKAEQKKTMETSQYSYEQVQELLDSGKLAAAEKYLKKLALDDKKDWNAPNLLGNLALAAGDFDKAYDYYKEALDIDPSQGEIHNNIGVLQLKMKNGQEALNAFLMAVALEPENSEALANVSMMYRAGGDLENAARYLQRAVNAQPDNVTTQFELISTLLALGKLKESAIQCQIVVDHHPNSVQVRTDLGFLLLDNNIIDDAAGQFGKAINLDQNSARSWYGLGLAARRLGQVQTALTAFTKAAALAPDQPDYQADLALTTMSLATPEAIAESEKILLTAVLDTPDHPRLLYLTGLFYDEQNNSSEAINYYRQAYNQGMSHAGFLLKYGALLLETGKTAQGKELLNTVATDPDASEIQRTQVEKLLQGIQ